VRGKTESRGKKRERERRERRKAVEKSENTGLPSF